MDEETRKAFDNVMLGICAIEAMVASLMQMVASLMLNDAIEDGDEERVETIKGMMEGMMEQTKKVSAVFADEVKRG